MISIIIITSILIIAHYWLLIDNIKLILILSEDTIPVNLSALAQGQLV